MAIAVCRICLNTTSKMYKYDSYQLGTYYEQIMGTQVSGKDGLPRDFCYQCAALLHKYHKFKEKCHTGQKILQKILSNESLTPKSLIKAKIQTEKLKSSIDILSTSRRVKTYSVKSQECTTIFRTVVPKRVLLKNDLENIVVDDLPNDKDVDDNMETEMATEKEEFTIEDVEHTKNDNDYIILETKIEVCDESILPDATRADNIFSDDDDVSDSGNIETKIADKVVEKAPSKTNKKSRNVKKRNVKKKDNSKKFEVNDTLKLDPKNWLKFNLTEEEALEEFNARSKNKKYLSAEYKCTDCFKGFSKEDMLMRHVKLRHDESNGPFDCRFCHMKFVWKCLLGKHMREHYTKFKCLRCDLVCPLETTAKYHEDYHNGVLWKCKYCSTEFKHMSTYYTHLRTHRSEHVCALCGASFVSAIGLEIHRKRKHVNVTAENQQNQDDKEYCKRCDIKFETQVAYDEHLVNSSMHVDGVDEVEVKSQPPVISQRKRKRLLRKVSRKPTDCHMCGEHFTTLTAFKRHRHEAHPRMPCSSTERQICEFCGISLAPGSVASHLNTHTKEKKYTCNTCGRQFATKGALKIHQVTHTNEKPVGCPLCDKRFTQSGSMKLHYRTFHLKEPYPKRNRNKKNEDIMRLDDFVRASNDNTSVNRWR